MPQVEHDGSEDVEAHFCISVVSIALGLRGFGVGSHRLHDGCPFLGEVEQGGAHRFGFSG